MPTPELKSIILKLMVTLEHYTYTQCHYWPRRTGLLFYMGVWMALLNVMSDANGKNQVAWT